MAKKRKKSSLNSSLKNVKKAVSIRQEKSTNTNKNNDNNNTNNNTNIHQEQVNENNNIFEKERETSYNNDDEEIIPRELTFQTSDDRSETLIIDVNTGEIIAEIDTQEYSHNEDYRNEYKEYYQDIFESSFEGEFNYAHATLYNFNNELSKLPEKIANDIRLLIQKAENDIGVDAVAFALYSTEPLWEITVKQQFASDKVHEEFASQFLNYLPNASENWIKETMEEMEYHEGVFEDSIY